MRPQLSVVVAVHNEADNVLSVSAEIQSALDGCISYEVVFVDDGSNDDTATRLSTLVASSCRIRLIRHHRRAGQSAAILTGVRAARGLWIATLDGDGQNDPADIPRLLAMMCGPDAQPARRLVVGDRQERRDSGTKRFASRVANAVRGRVLGDRAPDSGCGLKVFGREAFLALPRFDHMHRFLPALFLRDGWQIASARVKHRPRRHGKSHYGVLDRLRVGLVDLLGVLWLKRRAMHPVAVEAADGA